MENNTIFSAADILLPDCKNEKEDYEKWAVIACDQFTSEPEYWQAAEKKVNDAPTTLDYILPEAYLETEKGELYSAKIKENMKNAEKKLKKYENSMVYVERTLPDGKIRYGVVGKIDLEEYDYTPESESSVRATEKTVIERIPPRVAVRSAATVEFPHIMIFADDGENKIIGYLTECREKLETIYDFDLMLGGGHILGKAVEGETLKKLLSFVENYEKSKNGKMVYAVGDGNHSLASAKAHYENIKRELGEKALNHPARYALAEIVNLHDASIEFEPIYRILKNCEPKDVINALKNAEKGHGTITAIVENEEILVESPAGHPLVIGAVQKFIDSYIKEHPQVVCDYIHGESTLKTLVENDSKSVGFLYKGVDKEELFDYVTENGTLPRKTFSMGEAKSKRYYIEARKIVF